MLLQRWLLIDTGEHALKISGNNNKKYFSLKNYLQRLRNFVSEHRFLKKNKAISFKNALILST